MEKLFRGCGFAKVGWDKTRTAGSDGEFAGGLRQCVARAGNALDVGGHGCRIKRPTLISVIERDLNSGYGMARVGIRGADLERVREGFSGDPGLMVAGRG